MAEIEKGKPGMAQKLEVRRANFQFQFPFMLEEEKIEGFAEQLLEKGFVFFDLGNLDQQKMFYGGEEVDHYAMSKYFMPNIKPFLYPDSYKLKPALRRFTKPINKEYQLKNKFIETSFTIHSVDVYICPFHIGMMNVRISLPPGMEYSEVLTFADTFRIFEPIQQEDSTTRISSEDREEPYHKVKEFVFNELLTVLQEYMDSDTEHFDYFGNLPFFVDERMYVAGHIALEEDCDITETDLYRAVGLNGLDSDGNPYVGANNPDYIKRYCEEHAVDRWGDETYYISSDDAFISLTRAKGELEKQLSAQMYGQHFYTLLLFYYYQIVLLELTYQNSKINIEQDAADTELLIVMITEFTAKYYYPKVNSTTTGVELFELLKDTFKVEKLFRDVKETLADLYQNQDKLTGKRSSYLLEVLTIFSTISGIFGMNLVTENLKGDIPWKKMLHYNIYEYIALFITISGVFVSIALGVIFIKNWLSEKKSRRKQIF